MPRRLPLLGTSRVQVPAYAPSSRCDARGFIGIADTTEDEDALAFAVQLARALADAGARVHLSLLAAGHVPALPPALATSLAEARISSACHAVGPEPPAPATFAPLGDGETSHLLVGQPALTAYAPSLAILVGADRPVALWPAPLRAQSERVHVTLGTPRAGLAAALARSLLEHGFLPGG